MRRGGAQPEVTRFYGKVVLKERRRYFPPFSHYCVGIGTATCSIAAMSVLLFGLSTSSILVVVVVPGAHFVSKTHSLTPAPLLSKCFDCLSNVGLLLAASSRGFSLHFPFLLLLLPSLPKQSHTEPSLSPLLSPLSQQRAWSWWGKWALAVQWTREIKKVVPSP